MLIIATGYHDLNNKIKEKLTDSKIVNYREFLLKEKLKSDTILISPKLPGDIEMQNLIFTLKKSNCRVIYLTNEEDIDGILMCFNLAIYDFLFDPITVEKVLELIQNPKTFGEVSSVYLKYSSARIKNKEIEDLSQDEFKNQKPNVVEKIKVVEKRIVETRLIRQNIITFYCADNNILNNLILSNAAAAYQKKSKQKVLIVDFNTVPCIDHVLNVNKEILVKDNFNVNKIDTGLSACYSAIENQTFTASLLKKFIISNKKGLDVLTGLYDDGLIKKMDASHYEKILKIAGELYDIILISVNPFKYNTATAIAITKSNKVIVTCESNYTSARNTISTLKTFNNIGVLNNKFGIVLMNIFPEFLDIGILEKIFENYNVITEIPYNKNYNKCLNNKNILIESIYATRKDKDAYNKITYFMGVSNLKTVLDENDTEEKYKDVSNIEYSEKSKTKFPFKITFPSFIKTGK